MTRRGRAGRGFFPKAKVFILLIVLAIALLSANCSAVEIKNSMQIQGVKAKALITAQGSISGDLRGVPATIKILSFRDTDFQKIFSINERLEINGKTIGAENETDSFGNNIAVFRVNETGNFTYFIEAEITTNYYRNGLKDYLLDMPITGFDEFNAPTAFIESGDPSITTLAENEFDSKSELETIRKTAEFVHNYLEYDISFVGKEQSAVEALHSKKGVCGHFSELAAAILRAKKIPTRLVMGTVFSGADWNNHAWAEAFVPSSGWVQLDPTYGEAGLVDGTHIAMSIFPDTNNAIDSISAPTSAKISLEQKTISVAVQDAKEFSGIVEISAPDIEGPAQRWFDLNFSIKNLSENYSLVPVSLSLPKEILASEKNRILLLKPGEEKTAGSRAFADIALEQNQFLQGEYTISSFAPEITRQLKITQMPAEHMPAKIGVKKIAPIITGKNLAIEITLENTGNSEGDVNFEIAGNGIGLRQKETIGGLEEKKFAVTIGNYSAGIYTVKITAPGLDFEKRLTVKGAELPAAGTVPENRGENPENTEFSGRAGELQMETIIIAGAIIAAACAAVLVSMRFLRQKNTG